MPRDPVDDDVAAGRAALSRGDWLEARDRFAAALASQETPEALEGASWAAWWLIDVDACLDARLRAYHLYRDVGDERAAARMALWLGDDHREFHGADAVARGWFARAGRLLDPLELCPEHGWLTVLEAHEALLAGELDTAWQRAEQARDIGRRCEAGDLDLFGLAIEGATLVERGEVTAGVACLDEAATAALAGEYRDLAPAAWSCCLVMSACARIRDVDRAAQWCRQIETFSRRMPVPFLRGVCRAYRGAIETWRGRFAEADHLLTEALDELAAHGPAWRAEAAVRLGQLRRLQGHADTAAELFEQASGHPAALLGAAALRLDAGQALAARDLVDRALRRSPGEDPAGRADAIELQIRVDLHLGDLAGAGRWLDELRAAADRLATPPIAATVRELEGLLAAAEPDHERACDHLEDAIDLFLSAGAPVEASRVRVALATSLRELGRLDTARDELERALRDLEAAGAHREHDRVRALQARIAASSGFPAKPDAPLTERQVEVLRLVAEGLSNHQIADRLVLSPHTVHRHVANIFTRLGCSTRPAAVAEAARRGLL